MSTTHPVHFHIKKDILSKSLGLVVLAELPDGMYLGSMTMTKAVEGTVSWPAIQMSPESAQELMNELWNAGIRPSDQGSPGQLAAVQAHLADMRAIAFQALQFESNKK